MACWYQSTTVFERFDDQSTLEKAVKRLDPELASSLWIMTDGRVESSNPAALDALKQAYQVEKVKMQARKKGFFVSEKKQADGKIKITVRK